MPYVGFEPTMPASERAKTVHALDRSVTVTGSDKAWRKQFLIGNKSENFLFW
jgi:hypothetical protein